MTDRLSSGSDRLDAVLGGGLPRNGIVLIGGNPGSGKTILAQQYVFHNASTDRPAMYLTTVSEPLEKILRYGQALDFFDPAALGTSVIYEDLGRTLNDDGLAGALAYITELLKQHRPGLVVIDSFGPSRHTQPTRRRSEGSCTSWPGGSPRCRSPPSGSVSTTAPTPAMRPSSPSPMPSSRLVPSGKPNATGGSSRSSNCAAAAPCRASTPTGSPPQASTCSRAWPTSSSSTAMTARRNACPPAFRRWMPCWLMATTAVPSTLLAGPSGVGKTLLALHFIFAGSSAAKPG